MKTFAVFALRALPPAAVLWLAASAAVADPGSESAVVDGERSAGHRPAAAHAPRRLLIAGPGIGYGVAPPNDDRPGADDGSGAPLHVGGSESSNRYSLLPALQRLEAPPQR